MRIINLITAGQVCGQAAGQQGRTWSSPVWHKYSYWAAQAAEMKKTTNRAILIVFSYLSGLRLVSGIRQSGSANARLSCSEGKNASEAS